jgi:Uncharacterized membrane-associated protein
MGFIASVLNIVLHVDSYLRVAATDYGFWVYALMFLVVFCETGLVVTPFLPGDSLLFMSGTLAAAGVLGLWPAAIVLAAQAFYEKWGGLAIVLGRFMPIIRTFVPFTAGIGTMRYPRFLAYNALGGIMWVAAFASAGFFFGNVPFVQRNLTPIIYGIVLVSVLPAAIGAISGRIKGGRAKTAR